MEKTLTDILDKHPKAKLVILLGGEAWSSFLHLEDESTSSFLFSVQWHHATEYVFRRIRPISEAIIPKALT